MKNLEREIHLLKEKRVKVLKKKGDLDEFRIKAKMLRDKLDAWVDANTDWSLKNPLVEPAWNQKIDNIKNDLDRIITS